MADDADDQTSDRFLEVYLLSLFRWVLFCESAGYSVSRYLIPWAQRITHAPLEQMPRSARAALFWQLPMKGSRQCGLEGG
jgi:hypothetical protein